MNRPIPCLGAPSAHYVHIGRPAALSYRAALRELRGVDLEMGDARERLDGLRDARPIVRELEPEVWSVDDPEHGLRITLRVARWRDHAVVVGLSARPSEIATLGTAEWTHEALEQYRGSRGIPRAAAEAELRAAIWDAKPTDLEVEPERWRYRSGVDGLDVSIVAQPVDRAGARLVVSAEARDLNARGAGARRRHRRG